MQIKTSRFALELTRRWAISSTHGPGGAGGTDTFKTAFVELIEGEDSVGKGESAPSNRYGETIDTVLGFIGLVDPARLSFQDIPASLAYLDSLDSGQSAAKCALDIALWDGFGKLKGKPVYDLLGLGFREGHHITSFSIGLDTPEVIAEKVREASDYPVLKLKVGSSTDHENLAALRSVSPTKPVRVDANEAWETKEEALTQLEWLAKDGNIQFVEQPMPASMPLQDYVWLKARTPLPIMADESYRSSKDIATIAQCFHAVNVKLVKMGGISRSYEALMAARQAGLKTMLGCMIESSVLISAAAQLAELTDFLDIDGNILTRNDPFVGPTAVRGMISFEDAPTRTGLRTVRRAS